MAKADEIKQWLEQNRPDLPGAEVVDILCERYSGPGTQFSTADVEEQFPPDRERDVLATLQLLAHAQTGVFRGQWLFFDAEDEVFEIDPGDVDEALETHEFFHPLSGSTTTKSGSAWSISPGPTSPPAQCHERPRANPDEH